MAEESRRHELAGHYRSVRSLTEDLAAPLSAEDQVIQSMPDVSPTKWHRGHTSWFFETFLLEPELRGYETFHPAFAYIFNSYYEAVGARHPRAERGLISRPGVAEVGEYRRHVDEHMARLMDEPLAPKALDLIELGIHHEQQHQELLLMDIKHVLSCNPQRPAYLPGSAPARSETHKAEWVEHRGGPVETGHRGEGFAFDNESPRHVVQLTPFALADRPVTCGDWLAFMADGGYTRPELWLSDGWATIKQLGWCAPLYWSGPTDGDLPDLSRRGAGPATEDGAEGDGWRIFTLGGERPVDPDEPVCHVSYYEADAFAHWTGDRLPTEAEWEVVAAAAPAEGNVLDLGSLHPSLAPGSGSQLIGDVWEWTASAYSPYPGFRAPPGAVGEYNGKFMVNQYVLRGGSCLTPAGHTRVTYRNFFPAGARWAMSGVRLARDL